MVLMNKIIERLRRSPESQEDDGLPPADGHPSRAPDGSLWAMADDVDFFVPPIFSSQTLDYLSPNGVPAEKALRERFGLPTEELASEAAREDSESPARGLPEERVPDDDRRS
jgi:hypothetical protein